jgi:hypothetical protein
MVRTTAVPLGHWHPDHQHWQPIQPPYTSARTPIRDAVNGWLGELFDPQHVDETAAALVGAQSRPSTERDHRSRGVRRDRLTRQHRPALNDTKPERLAELYAATNPQGLLRAGDLACYRRRKPDPTANLNADGEASALPDVRAHGCADPWPFRAPWWSSAAPWGCA